MSGSIFDDTFIRYALSFEFVILTFRFTKVFLLILRLGFLVNLLKPTGYVMHQQV